MKVRETRILKAKAGEYDNGSLKGVRVENFPDWAFWLQRHSNRLARKKQDMLFAVCGDNRARFRSILGKPSFCWRGFHYHHCWLAELALGTMVLVFTARERGTCYEVVTRRGEATFDPDIPLVLKFMEALAKEK